MAESEKDRLAKQVAELRIAFDLALSDKRKYPVTEFNAFVRSARDYIKITAGDAMVHESVVQAVNGLKAFLQVERSGFPEISCSKRTDLNASSLLATIQALMATNLPVSKLCSWQSVRST